MKQKIMALTLAMLMFFNLILNTGTYADRKTLIRFYTLFNGQKYQEIVDDSQKDDLIDNLIKEWDFYSLSYILRSQYYLGLYEEEIALSDKILENSKEVQFILSKCNALYSLDRDEEEEKLIKDTLKKYEYKSLNLVNRIAYTTLLLMDDQTNDAIVKSKELLHGARYSGEKFSIYCNLSLGYTYLGDFENSKSNAELALKLYPNDSYGLSCLGVSYLLISDFETAREKFEQAIASNPLEPDAIYGMAVCLSSTNDLEAKKYWKQYNDIRPKLLMGWEDSYEFYKKTDDLEEMKISLEHIVSIIPDNRYYVKELMKLYTLSESEDELNKLVESYRDLKTKLEVDLLLSEVKYESGKKDESLDMIKTIIEETSSEDINFWDLYYICENFYYDDDPDYYEQTLNEIESKYGKNYRFDIELEIYDYFEEYEKLIDTATEYIKIDNKNSYAYQLMGDSYYFQKKYDKSLENYIKAKEFKEDKEDGKDLYYLNLVIAESMIYENKLSEADALIDETLLTNKDKGILYIHKARISKLNGKDQEAVNNLVKAFGKSKDLTYLIDEYEELSSLKGDRMLKKYIDKNDD